MKNYYFAVDLGATSGRTLLGSIADGKLETEVLNRFPNQLIHAGKHYYWDIYELYRNIVEGLKIVASRGIAIKSIGIDTWGVDFVLVGKDGAFLRLPRAYRDPHTDGAPEQLFARHSAEKVYATTGIQVMNFNSLFQIDTMRRNGDAALEAADKLLFVPDALGYLLTGEAVTEYTIATTGQIINAKTRRLDAELLKVVDLTEDNFGRFVMPGDLVGTLTPELQEETGLGAVPVVAVGGHDTASAVAAVPATTSNFAYLSSGTWSLMGVETGEPVINDRSRELNFTNEGAIDGSIRLLKNICGMWLLERCRKEWTDGGYVELIAEAEAAEAFRTLLNPDDPCFANPVKMIAAIKDYAARTNQPVPETQGQIVRCIFESLALRYRQVLDNLRELADHPIEVLHVIGGGARNAMLNHFTADAIGIPVVAGPSEATAIGNVAVQAVAAGECADIAAMRRIINESEELSTFYPGNTDVWDAAYKKFIEITK